MWGRIVGTGRGRGPGTVWLSLMAALNLALILAVGACGSEKTKSESESKSEPSESSSPAESAVESPVSEAESAGVEWANLTFEEAIAKAAETDRMILVNVWSDQCGQCGVMDEEVWDTPEGIQLVGDAIAIKIPSDARESYSFRYRYPITGLPAVLLLDSKGDEIDRIVGYQSRAQFLPDAHAMMTGLNPIPAMEERIASNPDNLALYFPLMEKYLFRAREIDARRMMDRILEIDPENSAGESEKAIRAMAKYYAFFRMDAGGSCEYWRMIPEKFPDSTSLTAAFKATLDQAKTTGTTGQWIDWICGLTEAHSGNGKFNSSVAMYAFRNNLTHSCLAEAALTAQRLGAAPAGIDSVARILGGGAAN